MVKILYNFIRIPFARVFVDPRSIFKSMALCIRVLSFDLKKRPLIRKTRLLGTPVIRNIFSCLNLCQGKSSLYIYKKLRLLETYFHGRDEFLISGCYCSHVYKCQRMTRVTLSLSLCEGHGDEAAEHPGDHVLLPGAGGRHHGQRHGHQPRRLAHIHVGARAPRNHSRAAQAGTSKRHNAFIC